ncbi:MAG: MarR family transcriptional regulator [Spirochaetales bacterium]|nr:MarR family transcriptional regulator [Spirochaetales bacterium]
MEQEIKLMELFMGLHKRLWKLVGPVIKESQMSITDIFLLRKLAKHQPCRATELASLIGVPTSTLTGIADRLEAGGYIKREHAKDDRRSVLMEVTPKVMLLVEEKKKAIGEILKQTFRSIPSDRKDRLVEDLQLMVDNLDKKIGNNAS